MDYKVKSRQFSERERAEWFLEMVMTFDRRRYNTFLDALCKFGRHDLAAKLVISGTPGDYVHLAGCNGSKTVNEFRVQIERARDIAMHKGRPQKHILLNLTLLPFE